MALTDWFSRRPTKGPGRVDLDVARLRDHFAAAVPHLERKAVEPALVRARLADGYRDAVLEGLPPAEFDEESAGLDDEGWRRLALAAAALELADVRHALPLLVGDDGPAGQVREAFLGLAAGLHLLTMELLRQSELRVEEFTRHFLARLGAHVAGETPQQSRQRLYRLDYARLLAQAEEAKLSAQERMEYLKKLQDEQERRTRRGKW